MQKHLMITAEILTFTKTNQYRPNRTQFLKEHTKTFLVLDTNRRKIPTSLRKLEAVSASHQLTN
jgi:hypothetical protein